MRAHPFFFSAVAALSIFLVPLSFAEEGTIAWEKLPNLPDSISGTTQVGLAGHFGGVHNGVTILAGGANFPEGPPWKNGVKTFWNEIYVLEKVGSEKTKWVSELKTKLPKPIAYGVSVSTPDGIVCIGGVDGTQCYADVMRLKWNPDTRDVEIEKLPPLPTTLAHMTAALVENVIYVAGGVTEPFGEGTKSFFALDLNPKPIPASEPVAPTLPSEETSLPETPPESTDVAPDTGSDPAPDAESDAESDGKSKDSPNKDKPTSGETNADEEPEPVKPEVIGDPANPSEVKPVPLEWKELPPWDGEPRAFAVSAAQADGAKPCFFLFSGRNPKPDGTSIQLADSHKFDPTTNQWVKFPDIALPDSSARSIVAASAITIGERSILIFGGDDGTMAKVSTLLISASNSTSRDAYLKLNETILENHPGYSRDILSLDTVDGVWSNVATFPDFCPVSTPAFLWDSKIVIPSGEISPGTRALSLWIGTWKPKKE